MDVQCIKALKELGGISAVVRGILDSILLRERENPRSKELVEKIEARKESLIGEVRGEVQGFLHGMPFGSSVKEGGAKGGKLSGPLPDGVYTELPLESEELRWKGIADVLKIRAGNAEITDFKTGERKQEHALQIQIYSLLWESDKTLNPEGRPAVKLSLNYRDGSSEVPLQVEEEKKAFRKSIIARTDSSLASIRQSPPSAKPNAENCHWCSVRQMCPDYWQTDDARKPAVENSDSPGWSDIEVKIVEVVGVKTWKGKLLSAAGDAGPKDCVLRTGLPGLDLKKGSRYRILSASPYINDEGQDQATFSLTRMTEVFAVQ